MELDHTVAGTLVGSLRRSDSDEMKYDELDRLIERRASQKQDADEREEGWKEGWKASVAAYHAEYREAHKHLWIAYYRRLARNHAGIAEHFDRRAAALSAGVDE